MPFYDFECQDCKKAETKLLKVAQRDEPTKVPCDWCGGEVKQKIGAPATIYSSSQGLKATEQ